MDNARPPHGPEQTSTRERASDSPSFLFLLYERGILAPAGWRQQDRIDEYVVISRLGDHETDVA